MRSLSVPADDDEELEQQQSQVLLLGLQAVGGLLDALQQLVAQNLQDVVREERQNRGDLLGPGGAEGGREKRSHVWVNSFATSYLGGLSRRRRLSIDQGNFKDPVLVSLTHTQTHRLHDGEQNRHRHESVTDVAAAWEGKRENRGGIWDS